MINDQERREYADSKMQHKTIYLAQLFSRYIHDHHDDLDDGVMEDLLKLSEMILEDYPLMIGKITEAEERNVKAIRAVFADKPDEN